MIKNATVQLPVVPVVKIMQNFGRQRADIAHIAREAMETWDGNRGSDGNIGNGVLSCGRQMLGDSNHRNTLSAMLNLTESNTFKEFAWDETHQTFIDFLTRERPEVLWLIRLQRKNQHQRLQTSIHTEELWMEEDTEGLRFEVDDTVRFSSECLIVRNVFLNWSARNPEVQFCSPICSKPLKALLEKEPVTFDDLKIVREISGQYVRNILEVDKQDSTVGGQRAQHSLSEGCRNLLSLILRIVDESLKTTSTRIAV